MASNAERPSGVRGAVNCDAVMFSYRTSALVQGKNGATVRGMRRFLAYASGALLSVVFGTTTARAQPTCPAQPQTTINSPTIPPDVCIPAGFVGFPIAFFDDYSWRAFIALVWPADLNHRGQPDAGKHVGDVSGPLVFETYKSEWELFGEKTPTPFAWDVFPQSNPCNNVPVVTIKDLVLGTFSFSKFGNLGEAGQGPPVPLVGTLVAQNGTYIRYLTGINQSEYEQIVSGKLYMAENQHNVTFANGALDVKSAWMDMTHVTNPERYYTQSGWLFDPATQTCSQKTVGLIALHIVQKTPSRPQWIWTTFEQVDNVPPSDGHPMALNDNSGQGMPDAFPPANQWPPKIPVPPPYNVVRVMPIHNSTQSTNKAYRTALAGTVWENYQLVATQWPVPVPPTAPTVDPAQPGKPSHTFPGNGANTAFANTAMETFDQESVTTGCMNCHNFTKGNTDFAWFLAVNGVTISPPPSPGHASAMALNKRVTPAWAASKLSPSLRQLLSLLSHAQSPGRQER